MSIFSKPEINSIEAVRLLFHSFWAILYHSFKYIADNIDKVGHIIWLIIFGLLFHFTGQFFWGYVAFPVAVLYPLLWALFIDRKAKQ